MYIPLHSLCSIYWSQASLYTAQTTPLYVIPSSFPYAWTWYLPFLLYTTCIFSFSILGCISTVPPKHTQPFFISPSTSDHTPFPPFPANFLYILYDFLYVLIFFCLCESLSQSPSLSFVYTQSHSFHVVLCSFHSLSWYIYSWKMTIIIKVLLHFPSFTLGTTSCIQTIWDFLKW